ncbi:antigen 5 like allergen Cul n 1-like [Drosophila innubila]|uniref:antigen 5 like allergen Cul n 1-like n=1 Tax=Drosophila innubila TaxID=198719 RepID=UPI00148DCDBC|nr:antigen 5 like allergen Cul n 1-like [Drosophila innubila]
MSLLPLIPLLLLLLSLLHLNNAFNYCNNGSHYCNVNGMKHFVCQLDDELHPLYEKAKFVGLVPDTIKLRNIFLQYHNSYRNKLAGGSLITNNNMTFKSASRMRELIWDEELAYTARLHAATVSFKHSLCRSVLRFPFAGECLGLVFASRGRRRIADILDLTLQAMFEEYLEAEDPDEVINSFDAQKHYDLGHFTVIVSDRVSRVGCALAAATDCEKETTDGYCHFLTCHYDFTNMASSYVYRTGESASKCNTWKTSPSKEHTNLCTNSGEIFPEDHGENESKLQGRILKF